MLKPEPETFRKARVSTPPEGGPPDVTVSEKHVWSLLFSRSKTLEKLLQKVIFSCTYNGAEKHVTCERFENAAFRTKTNVITTVHVTDDDVSFCDGPGMLIGKTAKLCINRMWIALLIHGFVPVKTWLLIACNTEFYIIILFKKG